MKKLVLLGAVALMAIPASACGRMADLDAPPRRTERSLPDGRSGPGPVEPATVNRPPSQVPIDGGPSSNPYGGSGSRPG